MLLYLDSRHRSNPTQDNGSSTFALTAPLHKVRSVELVSAVLPHSFYTVPEGKNTFILSISGLASATISIPIGIYTLTSLAASLQTTINVSGLAVAASLTTLKLTFTYTSAAFSVTPQSDLMGALLGLAPNIAHTSSANTVASSSCCELTPQCIHLTSKKLGSSYTSGTGRELPSTFTIPITEDAGSVIVFNNESSYRQKKNYPTTKDIGGELDITMRDAHGSVLNFNGLNWSVVLRIEQ